MYRMMRRTLTSAVVLPLILAAGPALVAALERGAISNSPRGSLRTQRLTIRCARPHRLEGAARGRLCGLCRPKLQAKGPRREGRFRIRRVIACVSGVASQWRRCLTEVE